MRRDGVSGGVGHGLANEAGLRRKNPPWSLVERMVRELDPGHGNSFACLSLPGNTYVQCLRGLNGYHLEWRVGGAGLHDYLHLRASYPGASAKRCALKKHDYISRGEHRDLLHLDDVVDAFRAFHGGDGPPGWLGWRALEL